MCCSAKGTNKKRMMRRVRWTSHGRSQGKTPISLVWGGRLTQIRSTSTCRGKAETVNDERNISSHSSQRERAVISIWERRLTSLFKVFLCERKRKSVHGERGHFSPYVVPWEDPKFLRFREEDSPTSSISFSEKEREKWRMMRGTFHPTTPIGKPFFLIWERGLTQLFKLCLCKRNKQCMMRRMRLPSHGCFYVKTPNSFSAGKETYSDLQHANLQRRSSVNAWWEEHLIPQLTKQDPNVFLYGNGDSPNFSYCFPGKEREKECMVGGDFSSRVQSLGMTPDSLSLVTATYSAVNPVPLPKRKSNTWWIGTACHPIEHPMFLGSREEDSPTASLCSTGKEREKQHMMRGTSHPTAHTGRPLFFI